MNPVSLLSCAELEAALAARPNWRLEPGGAAIRRDLRFAGFPAALAFMVQAGLAADRMDHHPEWTNVYDRVCVRLTTHEVGGVSPRDLALADVIDAISPEQRP